MLVGLAKLGGLVAAYAVGLCVGTLLHELGHALAALALTRQRVEVELGRGSVGGREWRGGRLGVRLGSWRVWTGATRYERAREGRGTQLAVALAGPAASFAATLVCVYGLAAQEAAGWWAVAWLGGAAANFRILIVSAWPMEHRPDGAGGVVWLSDGLDAWRLWRGGR